MFNKRDVNVGKFYVKDRTHIVREVIALIRHRKVVYNAYDLKTGRLLCTPHQICPRNQLVRWADREARPDESAKLKRDEAMAIFETEEGQTGIDDIPNEARKAYTMTELRHHTPSG